MNEWNECGVLQSVQIDQSKFQMVDLGKRLLEAAKQGLTEEVRSLMSNGAPFTTDWLGTSPLHFAALNGHLGTSEVLLRAGISRDARTKVDRTPLHAACQGGHMDIVELLVRNGADIDAKDMLRMTPLHWAVEKGHPVVIEYLLEHGAEVSCQNKFDKSPIDVAITNGRADLAQILQQNVIEVSTSAEDHPFVGEVMEVSAADAAETMAATEAVVQQHHRVSKKPSCFVTGESTEVLSTLAALAEATSGGGDGNMTNTATTDQETLKWLESQGITMTMADNSTIVANTVENGQQLTLTEAGRLALNQVVKQKGGQEAELVTIAGGDGMDGSITDSIVYTTNHIHPESEEEEDEDGPVVKRIKLEKSTSGDAQNDLVEGHHVLGDVSSGLDVVDDMNIKLEGVSGSPVYGDEEGEEVQEYSVETVTETL